MKILDNGLIYFEVGEILDMQDGSQVRCDVANDDDCSGCAFIAKDCASLACGKVRRMGGETVKFVRVENPRRLNHLKQRNMKNFLKRQREIRLRKWCAALSVKSTGSIIDAQSIYDWVTSKPRKSKP